MGGPRGPMTANERGAELDKTQQWLNKVFQDFDAADKNSVLADPDRGVEAAGIMPEFDRALKLLVGRQEFEELDDFKEAALKKAVLMQTAISNKVNNPDDASQIHHMIAAIPRGQLTQFIVDAHTDGMDYSFVSGKWVRERH